MTKKPSRTVSKKSGVEYLAQHPGWKTKKSGRTKKQEKPYVLVTVHGGVADIGVCKNSEVDILDFDNLKETAPGQATLSDKEWQYLKKNDPREYARLQLPESVVLDNALYRALVKLAQLVQAGNTEFEGLERRANEVLARVGK